MIGHKFMYEDKEVIIVSDNGNVGCHSCCFHGKFPAEKSTNFISCTFDNGDCLEAEIHYELVKEEEDQIPEDAEFYHENIGDRDNE